MKYECKFVLKHTEIYELTKIIEARNIKECIGACEAIRHDYSGHKFDKQKLLKDKDKITDINIKEVII